MTRKLPKFFNSWSSANHLRLLAICLAANVGKAGVVMLNTSDPQGTSSFIGATNWSNDAVPSGANDYVVNYLTVRTPADGLAHTFAGGSLTISNPPTSAYGSGVLAYKGSGGAITVGTTTTNGLFLDNGYLASFQGAQAWTFDGFATLKPGGGLVEPQSGTLTLAAQIGGPGSLSLFPTASASWSEGGTVWLTGSNSYTGGTFINGTYTLRTGNSNALGSVYALLCLTNGNSPSLDLNGNSIAVGTLAGVSGAKIYNSSTLPASLTIGGGNSGSGNYAGLIQDGNAPLALNKIGSGVATLSGTNLYCGGTTVSGGTLQMASWAGPFAGGGTVVLMAAATNSPQFIGGNGDQFTGSWVLASGWLAGITNGALGTNDIIVNPGYSLDASANGAPLAGAAIFEPRYDLNSAGRLTLTNGGKMWLHQNCVFSAAQIESNLLSAGTYSHALLMANFPNNFPAGGAGQITVQPFGSLPAWAPALPAFEIQPQAQTNFPASAAQFTAYAFGNPAPGYRWMAGAPGGGIYTNLTESGQFAGTGGGTLTINNLAPANALDYVVVATNFSGSVTSAPARLTLVPSAVIQTYPLPSIYSASSVYALTVNGVSVPIVSYTGDYDYAEFSMSNGAATFQVTALTQPGIVSARVSPEKLNLVTRAAGNTLTFTLLQSEYLIAQINGQKRLVIGADAAETDVPAASGTGIFNVTSAPYNADNTGTTKASAAIQSAIDDASSYGDANGQGTVFVPAGVYLSGDLRLKSNVALYLQGGSLIRCTGNPADYTTNETFGPLTAGMWFLSATNGFNMKIYGRGAVDADGGYMVSSKNFAVNTLMPLNCTNFTADGVTFRDSGGWTIIPCIGGNMTFSHLKVFNQLSTPNSDGIDVNCAHDIIVSNCISIGLDDCYSTKTYTNIPWAGANMADSNLLFDGCLAWTICYGFKVGQGVEQTQDGVIFRNGVVYDCAGALGVDHRYGTFPVRNVTFDTIDVEHVSYVNAGHGAWGAFFSENILGDGGGPITNLVVRNITVRDAGTTGGFLQGISSYASVDNPTFDHIYMPGSSQPASNLFQMAMTNTAYDSNVVILPVQISEPLLIESQPESVTQYLGEAESLAVTAWGNPPLNFQWEVQSNGVFVNLAESAQYSGAQSALLTVSNLAFVNSTNYLVVVSDDTGSVTSAVVALTVSPGLGPPQAVTMSSVEPNQNPAVDWDTGGYWSNGQSATTTAASYPGSTFEILAGAAMRTPATTSVAYFPGAILKVDGNGTFGSSSLGTVILKGADSSTVIFPNLTLSGGAIGNGINSAGNAIIGGVMDVVSNAIFSAGNSGSGGSITLAGRLTGGGNVEYHAYAGITFQPAWVCDLNVAGSNNNYSGTWNVVLGTLVASGNGALGTNKITVGSAGALQADYSINNPAGGLILNGRLNLTQTLCFHSVSVNGTALAPGQYSAAQLNGAYPANFPATWTAQPGASITNAAGSLIVGLPLVLNSSWNGSQLTLSWPGFGELLTATNLTGPWLTNAAAQSPFTVTPNGTQAFYQIKY